MEKQKVKIDSIQSRESLAELLREMARDLNCGRLSLTCGDKSIVLSTPTAVPITIEAKQKESKEKLSIEIEWRVPFPLAQKTQSAKLLEQTSDYECKAADNNEIVCEANVTITETSALPKEDVPLSIVLEDVIVEENTRQHHGTDLTSVNSAEDEKAETDDPPTQVEGKNKAQSRKKPAKSKSKSGVKSTAARRQSPKK